MWTLSGHSTSAWRDNTARFVPDPVHFGSVPVAMLTLFRVATFADWKDVFYINTYGCDRYLADMYIVQPNMTEPRKFDTRYGTFYQARFVSHCNNHIRSYQNHTSHQEKGVCLETTQSARLLYHCPRALVFLVRLRCPSEMADGSGILLRELHARGRIRDHFIVRRRHHDGNVQRGNVLIHLWCLSSTAYHLRRGTCWLLCILVA